MRLRAATPADARRVAELVIARDVAEIGEPDYSLGDLRDEWRELDLAHDTVIVEDDDGAMVGSAHFRGSDVLAQVDPRREGEGFGTAILEWSERRARHRERTRVRQGVGHLGESARALLEAHGYERTRSFWRMTRAAQPDATTDDHGLRPVQPADAPTLYGITIRAFASDGSYEIKPQEEWIRREFNGHDVDHALSRTDEGGTGYALVRRWDERTLYVPLLAVDPAHQGQGLGARLLRAVFAAAGERQVTLNVASDNPHAVKLYEQVGMRQAWRVDDYEKALPD